MDQSEIVTFLFGAGSAGTLVGSIMMWRIKKALNNVDEIPSLIKTVNDLKTTINSYSGEMRSIERSIHKNNTDIAVTAQKVEASFRRQDELRDYVRGLKI